jgi:hypothetical protein
MREAMPVPARMMAVAPISGVEHSDTPEIR